MANPRKFAEKIALHIQNQTASTSEFQQVLEEVSVVKKNVNPVQNRLNNSQNESMNRGADSNHISLQSHQMLINVQNQQQHNTIYGDNGQAILINQQTSNHLNPNNILAQNCRADSLPALTANEKSRSSIDLRSALSDFNEMKQGDSKKSHQRNRMPSPNNQIKNANQLARNKILIQRHPQQTATDQYQQYNGSYNDFNMNPNIPIQTTRSQVNLHYSASQQSNNIDQHFVHKSNHSSHHNRINPYYLSAPETNSWRRTNSDSALHQSTAIYCDQQQQQSVLQQPQNIYSLQNAQQNNQFYDSRQKQNVIIQQQQQSGSNKNNPHETDWDPGKIQQQQQTGQTNLNNNNVQQSQAQSTIMYHNNQLNKADLNNVTPITSGAPVININYQNQNTFSSSLNNGNNLNNSSTTIYTSPINQCTQNNYQQQQQQPNSTGYMTQQTNGNMNEKRPKSCDTGQPQQENNSNNNQFNRNLISNQNVSNRTGGQHLPILQFQSSSQNNINQQSNDHLTLFSNPNSNHIDHQSNHHHNSSNALHVNNFSNNTNSSNNFLYANTNACSGSLPDLSALNHPSAPLTIPLEQEDALSSGLNSNDNSNNSNQSSGSYQFNTNQFSGIASSVPNQSSIQMNYRSILANNNNFVPYCSNPNSSNSNSPLHQNAFTTNNLTGQQQMMNSQMTNVSGPNNGTINFSNKIMDNKRINTLTSNQLATQLNNHHISSPVRPSSNESAEEVVIFNQLTENDMLINNDYENDENIEQFDFDLFSSAQADKLIDSELDKISTDQDSNNNTNPDLTNFYQDQLMNHRNVSTPSENPSSTAPNSPASSIHNLNSPISSPTTVNTNNNSAVHINNNLADMHLNNDNNLSQNSTILPNKNDFTNDSHCMITNQPNNLKENGSINDEFFNLNIDQQSAALDNNESIFSDHDPNSKEQDIIMVNYCQTTPTSIPNIIFTEHNNDLSSIDELYSEMST